MNEFADALSKINSKTDVIDNKAKLARLGAKMKDQFKAY